MLITKHYSGDQIEKNEMGGACSMYGGEERCIQGFGGETEGKRSLRLRWQDNTKMDLQEVEWRDMDWIYLARDRYRWRDIVNAVMNLRVP